MLSMLMFLAVVSGSFLYTEASVVYKCDEGVIEKAKALGDNTGILEKLTTFGDMSVYKSTSDYFEPDVACTYISFYKEAGTIRENVYLGLKEAEKKRGKNQELIESDGVISDKDKILLRYTVYSKNNVFACYSCYTTAIAKVGPPTGYVAVKEHDYNQDDVNAAVAALESIGVSATATHPDVCP